MRAFAPSFAVAVLSLVLVRPAFAVPFASEVIGYTPGAGVPAGYDDPGTALGSPARVTGTGPFDGDINPLNAPWQADQIVSIGAGGELVVRFDHPIADDSANAYGVDLLVFGNAFFALDFDTGTATDFLFADPAAVSVSQDGVTWYDTGALADALFPTLAYQTNPNAPFGSGGSNPTCYTCPVDPSLTTASFVGLDVNQIGALYGGSGGGLGIDLAAVGLPWIEYVRVSLPADATYTAEIDAFADVPEPGTLTLVGVGLAALAARRTAARR